MLSLIWKEFYINRSSLAVPAALFMGISAVGLITRSARTLAYVVPMLITYSGLIMPFFALGSAMLEEKNRTLPFLRTLPIRSDVVVASKFIAPLLAALAWGCASALIFRIAGPYIAEISPGTVGIVAALCVSMLVTAVELVIFVKYGAAAARMSILVLWGGGFLAGTALSSSSISADEALRAVLEAKPGQIAAAVAVVLALYFAAMLMAQAIFRRKEM